MEELLKAISEFRESFVIAVGDKSPFARVALSRIDTAVLGAALQERVSQLETQVAMETKYDRLAYYERMKESARQQNASYAFGFWCGAIATEKTIR